MADDKIQLQHPQGKHMPRIDRDKYEITRKAMLSVLKGKEIIHTELFELLHEKLNGKFDGSISWYGESVKLDLEARKLIERTNDRPQKYRVKN